MLSMVVPTACTAEIETGGSLGLAPQPSFTCVLCANSVSKDAVEFLMTPEVVPWHTCSQHPLAGEQGTYLCIKSSPTFKKERPFLYGESIPSQCHLSSPG